MKKFLLFTGVFAMAAMLGGCGKTPVPDTPDPDPDDPDVPAALYEVGDYYEKGFLKGIVFNVDETGEHGYILALDETVTVWSYKDENVMYGTPATNGDYNCALVRESIRPTPDMLRNPVTTRVFWRPPRPTRTLLPARPGSTDALPPTAVWPSTTCCTGLRANMAPKSRMSST